MVRDFRFLALVIALLISLLSIELPSHARAQNRPEAKKMTFILVPPLKPSAIFGNSWQIFADGVIDKDSPIELGSLIKKFGVNDESEFYLNSPGGNLYAGMQIGEIIRSHRFRTYVGIIGKNNIHFDKKFPEIGGERFDTNPGTCASACTLSFLGGEFRYLNKGIYGVHRFFFLNNNSFGSDYAQIISSEIIQYIKKMGADEKLFAEMTKAGQTELNILSEQTLVNLGVVNNGLGPTAWSIEAAGPNGVYLKGFRKTVWGDQKIMFVCTPKNVQSLMFVMFDPKGRSKEISTMKALSIEIDGKDHGISPSQVGEWPTERNGWINAMIAIDDKLSSSISSAKTIGFYAQFAYNAPVFQGISEMDFSEGAIKYRALMKTCH